MKTNLKLAVFALFLSTLNLAPTTAFAQGTAFTYQGRLNDGANPASGIYDLQFTIYDAPSAGTPQGNSITNAATIISNGLFTVTLDFGNQFPGAGRWLEVGVRTNGGSAFAALGPRQQLSSAPYAVQAANATTAAMATTAASASSVTAGNITGTLTTAQLPASVLTNGASGVSISGSFSGSGLALTNLSVTSLQLAAARSAIVPWGQLRPDINFGQTNLPAGMTNVVAVAAAAGGFTGLALKSDGTVVAWGEEPGTGPVTNVPPGLSNVVAIAAQTFTCLALKKDGTVVAWGHAPTNPPASWTNVSALAAGWTHSLALRSNGTVVAWGDNSAGQTNVPATLSNVIAIAAGGYHSLALKSDGSVVGWGSNTNGQIDTTGLSNVVMIAAGSRHSVAVQTNGNLVAWGDNSSGQAGLPWDISTTATNYFFLNPRAIAAGPTYSMVINVDSTVSAWGTEPNYGNPMRLFIPPGLTNATANVTAIAAGGNFCLALQRFPAVPATVALLNQSNVFQGTITATGFIGNGSNLTSLNASQLTSGTVPSSALAGTYGGALTFSNAANNFTGNGSGLTALSASQLTIGIVPDARLSANVPLLSAGKLNDSVLSANVALRNVDNTFSGTQTINGGMFLWNGLSVRPSTVGSAAVEEFADATVSTFRAFCGMDGQGLTGVNQMYVGTYTAHPLTFYTADAPRMAITPAGNVGIGTTAPNYPLNFAATLGDKISLWDSGLGNHYGFGVQANQLQIHADSSSSDIVFGTGRSTNLAETMRIKGNGKVGIGTASVPRSGVGAAMLALGGSASSLAGPHLQYTVLSDDYPVFQQLNWSHDNISQCFDAYYDGVNWRSSSPNSSFQIYKLGSQLSFSTATATAGSVISWVPAMTLSSSGNIGIGTTTPNNKLHVLGNATIGTGSSAAALTLDDTSNAKWRLNTSGFKLAFENDNGGSFASKMVIQNNGNVGIGTTTPTKGSLEIDSGNGSDPQYSPAGFLNTGGAGSGTFGGTSFGSIWAVGAVFGNTFVAFSDERIKNVKSQSDSATDLKTLCGIQITDFTYKDAIAKGNRPQKKVIAQQVEQVFPQAVTTNTDVVPDIYQKATINNGWVQLATDLKVGDRVKLIGEKEKGVYAVLELREGAFRTDFKPGSESVFVYGREVKDFRNVDYEAIAMLNVSATQELARRLKSQQESLTRLQGNLDQAMADKEALLSRLSVLEERDQACEARLARMERALEKGSATGSHVSLNRVNGGAQ